MLDPRGWSRSGTAKKGAIMTTLDSDRFANIKRLGGDAAAMRMLLAAKDNGAEPRALVDIAKEIELSHTALAKLRALLGVSQVDPKNPTGERRKKARPLDRFRERRALERLVQSEQKNKGGFVAHAVADDHVDDVLRLFGAYFEKSFDVDTDEAALFVLRDSDDDKLWLCAIARHKELATRITPALSAADVPTRVDGETFADVFPNAAPIDELEVEGIVRLIVRGAKGF